MNPKSSLTQRFKPGRAAGASTSTWERLLGERKSATKVLFSVLEEKYGFSWVFPSFQLQVRCHLPSAGIPPPPPPPSSTFIAFLIVCVFVGVGGYHNATTGHAWLFFKGFSKGSGECSHSENAWRVICQMPLGMACVKPIKTPCSINAEAIQHKRSAKTERA